MPTMKAIRRATSAVAKLEEQAFKLHVQQHVALLQAKCSATFEVECDQFLHNHRDMHSGPCLGGRFSWGGHTEGTTGNKIKIVPNRRKRKKR
jgi:hypothetical protein